MMSLLTIDDHTQLKNPIRFTAVTSSAHTLPLRITIAVAQAITLTMSGALITNIVKNISTTGAVEVIQMITGKSSQDSLKGVPNPQVNVSIIVMIFTTKEIMNPVENTNLAKSTSMAMMNINMAKMLSIIKI
jgi:hypothetical protein